MERSKSRSIPQFHIGSMCIGQLRLHGAACYGFDYFGLVKPRAAAQFINNSGALYQKYYKITLWKRWLHSISGHYGELYVYLRTLKYSSPTLFSSQTLFCIFKTNFCANKMIRKSSFIPLCTVWLSLLNHIKKLTFYTKSVVIKHTRTISIL